MVSAATLMVMEVVPVFPFTLDTVNVTVPLAVEDAGDTVATVVSPDVAVILPVPYRDTVKVAVSVLAFSTMLDLLSVMFPAALPMVQFTLFAEVVPSDH